MLHLQLYASFCGTLAQYVVFGALIVACEGSHSAPLSLTLQTDGGGCRVDRLTGSASAQLIIHIVIHTTAGRLEAGGHILHTHGSELHLDSILCHSLYYSCGQTRVLWRCGRVSCHYGLHLRLVKNRFRDIARPDGRALTVAPAARAETG